MGGLTKNHRELKQHHVAKIYLLNEGRGAGNEPENSDGGHEETKSDVQLGL